MDEIARRASINKAAIYYHIGDKEALYAAVLNEIFGQTAGRIEKDVQKAVTPVEKIRAYIRNITDTVERHPHMAPMMMREIASGGPNLPEPMLKDLVRMIGMLARILSQGEKEGVFTLAVPFVIHLMVISTAVFFKASFAVRQSHDAIPPELKTVEKSLPEGGIGAEIERLVLNAIRADRAGL